MCYYSNNKSIRSVIVMKQEEAEKLDKEGKSIVYSKNLSEDQLASLSQEFQLAELEEVSIFSVLSDDAKKFLLKLEPATGVIANSIVLQAEGKAPEGMVSIENPLLSDLAKDYNNRVKKDKSNATELLNELADRYVDKLYPDSDE